MNETQEARGSVLAAMPTAGFSLVPTTFEEGYRIAQLLARSTFCPAAMRGKPEDVLAALVMGNEVGLSPMQALQGIAVINGRPSLWGDALIGVARRDPSVLSITETLEGEGEKMVATCTVQRDRNGHVETTTRTFSVDDAKKAKLWGKRGKDGQDTPWITYPQRMLQMRARGWAIRDAAADVIKGLAVAEEMLDAEPLKNVTPLPAQSGNGADGMDPRVVEMNESLKWTRAKIETESKAVGYDVDKLLERMQADLDNPKTSKAPKSPSSPVIQPEVAEAIVERLPPRTPPEPNGVPMTTGTQKHLFGLLGELGIKAKPDRLRWAARYGITVTSFTQLCENQADYLVECAEGEGPEGIPSPPQEAQ